MESLQTGIRIAFSVLKIPEWLGGKETGGLQVPGNSCTHYSRPDLPWVDERLKGGRDRAGQSGWLVIAASLQSIVKVSEWRGAVSAITLKLDCK